MKKIYHCFIVFLWSVGMSMSLILLTGNLTYAIEDVNISANTKDKSSTEFFTSNGGAIYLHILDSPVKDTDQFLSVHLKRKVGEDWVTVQEQDEESDDSPLIFDQDIMTHVALYRFDFALDGSEVENVTYQIKQAEPRSYVTSDSFDKLVPVFDAKHQGIIYQALFKNKLVGVKGNLTYQHGDQQSVTFVDHQDVENDEDKHIPLLDFEKEHWPKETVYDPNGKEDEKGSKQTLKISFVGDLTQEEAVDEDTVDDEDTVEEDTEDETEEAVKEDVLFQSTLDFSRRLAKLHLDQQMKNDQVIVTASSPVSVPNKTLSKWKFQVVDKDSKEVLKTEEKDITSDKLHASHAFKKSDFKGKKNVQMVVNVERVDLTKGEEELPLDELLLTRGEGMADVKQLETEKKEVPVKEPSHLPQKTQNEKTSVEEDQVKPEGKKDVDETPEEPTTKMEDLMHETQPKVGKITGKIKLTSSILPDQKVEVQANLEGAVAPKGTWTISLNGSSTQTIENQGGQIKTSLPIQGVDEKEVPVTVKFVGKDKSNQEIHAESTENITVKNEESPPQPKETKAEEEEFVVADVIKTNAHVNGQLGGKLPKTANHYGNHLLFGIFFLLTGVWLLYRRNRTQ